MSPGCTAAPAGLPQYMPNRKCYIDGRVYSSGRPGLTSSKHLFTISAFTSTSHPRSLPSLTSKTNFHSRFMRLAEICPCFSHSPELLTHTSASLLPLITLLLQDKYAPNHFFFFRFLQMHKAVKSLRVTISVDIPSR